MSRRTVSISSLADSVLAEVAAADRVKKAEVEAVRTTAPRYEAEISTLLRKTAAELRAAPTDPSYADLNAFMTGKL